MTKILHYTSHLTGVNEVYITYYINVIQQWHVVQQQKTGPAKMQDGYVHSVWVWLQVIIDGGRLASNRFGRAGNRLGGSSGADTVVLW